MGFYTTTFSLFLSRMHALPAPRIGILIAIFMLPFALLSYPFGRLAERQSRVAMVAAGASSTASAPLTLGFWPVGALCRG